MTIIQAQPLKQFGISGPASALDNEVPVFDGITGKKIKAATGIICPSSGRLELSSTAPYLTLHNTTHEDTDYGRESELIFKGEQSGGEETTLGKIQVAHDGTADDQKGIMSFKVNDGNDGDVPTTVMTILADRKVEILGTKPMLRLNDGTYYVDIGTHFSDGGFKITGPSEAALFLEADTQSKKVFVFEYGEDHVQAIPGGASHYYFFEDSISGRNKEVRLYGYPTGGSNDYAQLQIVGVNNDLEITTNKASSDILLNPAGNVGIDMPAPSAKLDINSDIIRLRTAKTPASAGAAGNQGDECWDADYHYRCVATNTWKRTALTTW